MAVRQMLLSLLLLGAAPLHAADHAAVLMYHHISTDTPASTSVTPAVFARHLAYLDRGGYTVWPLGRILNTLVSGAPLPDKTVAITFDDAYRSVLEQAAPMLKKYGWPYTIFVNTQAIEEHYRGYLGWDELGTLVKDGAEIGNHSFSHGHLVRRLDGESDPQWRTRIEADIQQAQQQLRDHLGVSPTLFSYPYGEFTAELQEMVKSLGYYGIGQQSGAIDSDFDRLAVPRFPLATQFADMARFAIAVNARPLPVKNISAAPTIVPAGQTAQQHYSFDLMPGNYRLKELACYSNDGRQLPITQQERDGTMHIAMSLPDWAAGRRKINCTAPSSKENGIYYWYAQQWLVKQADGGWYRE